LKSEFPEANVLNVIRSTKKIERLIFVACNFEASYKNLVHLAKPASKQTPGFPFLPVKVVPVDLFPHTLHFEVIIYLERRAPTSDIPKSIDDSGKVKTEHEEGGQQEAAEKEANGHLPPAATAAATLSPKKVAGGAASREAAGEKPDLVQKFQKLFGGGYNPNLMLSKQAKRKRNRLLECKNISLLCGKVENGI
jgi:hypothetical protein